MNEYTTETRRNTFPKSDCVCQRWRFSPETPVFTFTTQERKPENPIISGFLDFHPFHRDRELAHSDVVKQFSTRAICSILSVRGKEATNVSDLRIAPPTKTARFESLLKQEWMSGKKGRNHFTKRKNYYGTAGPGSK